MNGFAGVFLVLFVALYVWSLMWVYRDAESRGKSGLLVVLLAALFWWPVSLLIWIAFRPVYAVPDRTR
jgi:hypothetical protein